jgi:hypothetical protein
VDPNYLELRTLTKQMPVWAINTPHNRAVAEQEWKESTAWTTSAGLTLFDSTTPNNGEANCIAQLDTVDLHHGEWSSGMPIQTLHVIGVAITDALRKALNDYKLTCIIVTNDGFIASSAETSGN